MNNPTITKADSFQETNIYGVNACGNNSSMMRAAANATGTGNTVEAIVNN